MSEMIERVGEALAKACKEEFGSTWSNDVRWKFARAAIDAMGEMDAETIDTIAAAYVRQAWPGSPIDKWPAADAELMKARLAKAFSEALSK